MAKRIVLAAAALGTLWLLSGLATTAQSEADDACRQSCEDQSSECVSACGQHSNPVECEARCHDGRFECIQSC